jgi:hypothetical protein
MTATLAAPSVWDKSLPSLARAAVLPEAVAAASYVGDWLAVLAQEPARLGECCGELDDYADDLSRRGVLVGDQGAGFLLALWVRLNPRSPLDGTHDWFVARRKELKGWRFCKWRGWVSVAEFDSWRFDRARERAALESKFARER